MIHSPKDFTETLRLLHVGRDTEARDHDFSHIVEDMVISLVHISEPLTDNQCAILADYLDRFIDHAYNCGACDALGV